MKKLFPNCFLEVDCFFAIISTRSNSQETSPRKFSQNRRRMEKVFDGTNTVARFEGILFTTRTNCIEGFIVCLQARNSDSLCLRNRSVSQEK
jgi:hypothetical protein